MDLAPTIERYMSLKREKEALLREHNLTQQNASLNTDRDRHLAESLNTSNGVSLAELEQIQKELIAMGEEVLDELKKAKAMNKKRTSSRDHQPHMKTVEFEFRVLTSSVREVERKMDEIKVLLQQM